MVYITKEKNEAHAFLAAFPYRRGFLIKVGSEQEPVETFKNKLFNGYI